MLFNIRKSFSSLVWDFKIPISMNEYWCTVHLKYILHWGWHGIGNIISMRHLLNCKKPNQFLRKSLSSLNCLQDQQLERRTPSVLTVPFWSFFASGFFRTVVKLHSGWELFSLLLDSLKQKGHDVHNASHNRTPSKHR